jgi:radical SAM superfamily enzyme YgiQ (UPF0313 family)
MPKLTMIYPSRTKESLNTELLYSPLALAYLARHTPPDFRIQLEDEYVGEDVDPRRVDADLVAFSPITPGITRAYELADALRKRGITCVAGGAHVSALPGEGLEHFDSVVVGEGEIPWERLVADFEAGRLEQKYVGRMDVSLENLGTPMRRYIHPKYRAPAVMTSRGCPHACSFCYLNAFPHRKYRPIPRETVLEDLDTIRNEPYVIVTDENFMGYSRDDIEDRKVLLESMIRRGYGFIWGCQTTVNLAYEPELMDLMYRSGCRAVFIGFEAVNPEGLKEINKPQNYSVDYHDAVRRLHDHKIAVIASCIIGLDSQEYGYHRKLIRALKETKVDFPRVFFMTAWPGTPLFDKLEKQERASSDWDDVRKDVPAIKFKNYSHKQLLAARKEVMDEFFHPLNITRVLGRWILKDRTLIKFFLESAIRNRVIERFRLKRVSKQIVRDSARQAAAESVAVQGR